MNLISKTLLISPALVFCAGIAMGQTDPVEYPIVVTDTTSAVTFSDLEYINQVNTSTNSGAPGYSVSAVYVNRGATVSIANSDFSNNHLTVANSADVSTALIHSGVADLNISNSVFQGNTSYSVRSAATQSTGVSGSVIKMFVGNRSGTPNKGNLVVENVVFDSNQSLSEYQAFGNVYLTNPNSAVFRNSTFTNNLSGGVASGAINALGGAISGYGIGDTLIENSTFQGNVGISSYWARGGALFANTEYSVWKDYNVSLNIKNSNFIGNAAVQVETEFTGSMGPDVWAAGGALYIAKTGAAQTNFQVEIADSTFTGNYASVAGYSGSPGTRTIGGGAIYNQDANIRISATRDIANTGNYVSVLGEQEDARGGFLYMKGGSTEFAIAEGATMTIGDGNAGYDSIASYDHTSAIAKTGKGALLVNSSMEYFTGTLNVSEGSMAAAGKIGASRISTEEGATLILTVGGDDTLSNQDLILSNQGTINLVAKNGIRENVDFRVAASSGVNFGDVKAYGGTFADNVFSINYAGEIKLSDPEPVRITQNSVLSILDEEGGFEFEMAFNVAGGNVEVVDISNVTSSLEQAIFGDFSYIAAYSFAVEMEEGNSVRLSFSIENPDFDISMFSVYYKSGDG